MKKTECINFGTKIPPPPSHLNADAKKEYRRVAKAMEEAGEGYLQVVDVALLSIYAQAWSDVRTLSPLVDGNWTLTSDKGNAYPNPLASALSEAKNRVASTSKELGFSPNSRKRIGDIIPKRKEKGALSKFMNNS